MGSGQQEDGEHDELAPAHTLGQGSAKGRAESDSEGGCADRAPHLGFGGMKDLLEERQQRLSGIEIEERRNPGKGHRDDGARVTSSLRMPSRELPDISGLPRSQQRVSGLLTGDRIFPEACHDTSGYHRRPELTVMRAPRHCHFVSSTAIRRVASCLASRRLLAAFIYGVYLPRLLSAQAKLGDGHQLHVGGSLVNAADF